MPAFVTCRDWGNSKSQTVRPLWQISKPGTLDYGTRQSTIRPLHSVNGILSSQKIHHSSLRYDIFFVSKAQISLARFIILRDVIIFRKIYENIYKFQQNNTRRQVVYYKRNIEARSRNHYIFRVCVCVCVCTLNLYSMRRTCAILHVYCLCSVWSYRIFPHYLINGTT